MNREATHIVVEILINKSAVFKAIAGRNASAMQPASNAGCTEIEWPIRRITLDGLFCINQHGFHCEDGPAVVRDTGAKEWWINGQLHREDGPAIQISRGVASKNRYACDEYFIYGEKIYKQQFNNPEFVQKLILKHKMIKTLEM